MIFTNWRRVIGSDPENIPLPEPLIMPQTSTLTEFVLAAHFETDLSLTVIDMADWAKLFSGDFPVVQQLPPHGRLELVSNAFQLTQAPNLPLLVLVSGDGNYTLRLQADRLAFGWIRTTPPGTPGAYPGFDQMMQRWQHHAATFAEWSQQRFGSRPTVRLMELTYNNAIPVDPEGKPPRLADIFAFMNPIGRSFNSFQMAWTELIAPDPSAARVHVQVGMGMLANAQPALVYNFVGVSLAAGDLVGADATAALGALHARILDMHRDAIISGRVQENQAGEVSDVS